MTDYSKKQTSSVSPSADKKGKDREGEEMLMKEKDVWEKARIEAESAAAEKTAKERLSEKERELVEKQIRREIEMMELNPELKNEAAQKAKKIEFLGEEEKIKRLITIAKERGLAFAIKVAQDTNDPYLLDVFHDILANQGFYKTFLPKTKDDE